MKKIWVRIVYLIASSQFSIPVAASRIKDIASIKGVRDNQLLGYGLVVGLKGSGDSKREFTGMSMTQMLRQMGVDVKTEITDSKNVAAVVITATLPPFARVGSKIDVLVNSIGDAKSLEGGTLLMSPLRGGDKAVYVVAQGPLSVGGFAAGGGGSSSSKNHPTIGRIPNGGIIEKEVNQDFANRNAIRLALHNPDFTTAARLAKTVNKELGGLFARARDSTTVDVMLPYEFEGGPVELIALLERLNIEQDMSAKIVINERTGTIIMGEAVRVSTVAIAHGNLTLEIKNKESSTNVTPADALLANATTPGGVKSPIVDSSVKETTIKINEAGDKLISVPQGATMGDVVRGLNALGVTPRDLIGILQSLKTQGALQAELEIL